MYMCLLIEGSNRWLKLFDSCGGGGCKKCKPKKTILGIRWL